jgi:O-methyltransferase
MPPTRIYVYPPGYGRSPVSSDYRPWENDAAFLSVWREVRDTTLVDQARLYELWELVPQVAHLRGAILEVGAWRGGSAALVARRLGDIGVEKMLYVADTFAGVVKASDRDEYYRGGEHSDTSLDRVESFFHSLAIRNFRLLQGVFPDETAHLVDSDAIALCHIDVDVYRSAADVFDWSWPRISVGGVCVFDDYGFLGCEGVTRLVHEIRTRRDALVVANLNGHAVAVKISESNDGER